MCFGKSKASVQLEKKLLDKNSLAAFFSRACLTLCSTILSVHSIIDLLVSNSIERNFLIE